MNYGIVNTVDLYDYSGPAGQLELRQRWAHNVTGDPSNSLVAGGGAAAKGAVAGVTPSDRARNARRGFDRFFESQGQSFRTVSDALARGAITNPIRPTRGAPGAGGGRNGRSTLTASDPNGWINWWYQYDNDGRLSEVDYPRRDETVPRTYVTYSYDNGWTNQVDTWLSNPFYSNGDPQGFRVTNAFNPSGTTSVTDVYRNWGGSTTKLFSVAATDFAGTPSMGTWAVTRQPFPSGVGVESITYGYDKSANIVSQNSRTFAYDSRGRLIRETGSPSADYSYDGFGNLANYGGTSLVADRSNNRLVSYQFPWVDYDYSNGTIIGHATPGMGRMEYDWYPDGRKTSEYRADGGHYPAWGNTVAVLDHKGEKALHYWGNEGDCPGQLFRYRIPDESNQVMTEYKGYTTNQCDCTPEAQCNWSVQYQKDLVWIGSNVLITRDRDNTFLHARDYLGTVRHTFNISGGLLESNTQLKAFGDGPQPQNTRHLFTGHERLHMVGEPSSQYGITTDDMKARTTLPFLGRFLSPDSVRGREPMPQSWNRYTYALNNPLRFVDPDGRQALQVVSTAEGINLAYGLGLMSAEEHSSLLQMRQQQKDITSLVGVVVPGPAEMKGAQLLGGFFVAGVRFGRGGRTAYTISTVAQDVAQKGFHVKVDGIELALRPSAGGGIVFRSVFSSQDAKAVAAASGVMETVLKDPKEVARLLAATRRSRELLRGMDSEFAVARGAELHFLEKALEKLLP